MVLVLAVAFNSPTDCVWRQTGCCAGADIYTHVLNDVLEGFLRQRLCEEIRQVVLRVYSDGVDSPFLGNVT